LRLRHPADLALDLAHERLDLLGRGVGLLALHLDRGAAILLVDEVELERGIDHQHGGHQTDEQGDVFEEQPALHSITWSARRMRAGRSTGKSAA